MEFSAQATRKLGPLAVWQWLVLIGAVGFLFVRMRNKGKSAAGGGSSPGQGNQFTSTQSSSNTDDKGNTTQSSYSATGNGFMPGMLTYGAGQMPFSQGDVYVNYPSSGGPVTLPAETAPKPIYGGRTHGFWYTTPRAMYPQEVAQHAYNLADFKGQPDFVSLAYDAMAIVLANPDLSIGNDNLIPAGVKLFVPGNPGDPKTNASAWDNFTDSDKVPYIAPPVVPVPNSGVVSKPITGKV